MPDRELLAIAPLPSRPEDLARAIREFHDEAEPFVWGKCGILSQRNSDGMTAELREALRIFTETQDEIAREYMRRVATAYLDAVVTGTGFIKLPPHG